MIAPGLTTARRSLVAALLHQVPGRPLGDRLRLRVGGDRGVGGVGPVVLGQRAVEPESRGLAPIEATDEVTTTRLAPASSAARRTRSVPSRAGTMSSSGSSGCFGGKGEATCST